MRNIQKLIKQYEEQFLNKYKHKKFNNHLEKNIYCSFLAEIWAYMDAVIPEGFSRYTIFDFDGIVNKRAQLPISIVTSAKDIISKYCWGMSWKEIGEKYPTDEEKKTFLRNNSVMIQRMTNGNNMVIFGEASIPLGRTLCASIIMKEAIKSRMYAGQKGQTYEWVEMSILKDVLLREKQNYDLADYRTCDWLVVDNILKTDMISSKQRAFISELVNPFFIERLNNYLSTILVFRFDIRHNVTTLEDRVGIGIANMVNSNRTYKMPLSYYLEEKNAD